LQEVIDRCWALYPTVGGTYRATDHRWTFPTGATVTLGHMQHEDDKYNFQGKEFQMVGFDELTQFTETQYTYLFSRVRSTVPEIHPMVRSTTNPGGIGHVWCKERFIDRMTAGKTFIDPNTGLSRVFIPGKLEDNPSLADNDPGYVARIEALPEVERRRLRDGDWDIFSGQVFPELSMRTHGVEPFDIPPEWERMMVFDWGYASPFSCGWYAIDYDGDMYRYREWYGCKEGEHDTGLKMVAHEVAREIRRLEADAGENIRYRIADPSVHDFLPKIRKGESLSRTIMEDFANEGVYFLKAQKRTTTNARVQGKMQVHERLKLIEDIDKETGELLNEKPRLFVFNDHEHFWRTVPALQSDPRNPEDVNTATEDHIYDEVRYACMARPITPKKVVTIAQGTFAHERSRLLRAKKYAARMGVSLAAAYRKIR